MIRSRLKRALEIRKLKLWAPLLLIDKLEPGDIILFRGSQLHSCVIACRTSQKNRAAGAGIYSHAAIWLPGDKPFADVLVESDGSGVGETPLWPFFISHCGSMHRAVCFEHTSDILVLRHPKIAKKTREELRQAVPVLEELFGQRFSRVEPFLHAGELTRLEEWLAAPIARAIDKVLQRAHPGAEFGPFCSQLVATFYRHLGVALFTSERGPEMTNPNHYVSAEALATKQIHAAVLTRPDMEHVTVESDAERPKGFPKRAAHVGFHAAVREKSGVLERAYAESERGIEEHEKRLLLEEAPRTLTVIRQYVEDLGRDGVWGAAHSAAVARLREDLRRLELLHQVALSVQPATGAPISSWDPKYLAARREFAVLSDGVHRRLVRTKVLASLRIGRAMERVAPVLRGDRLQHRKVVINEWVRFNEATSASRKLVGDLET